MKNSIKNGENHNNLRLRKNINDVKEEHDVLVEKIKIRQRRVFPFCENQ